MPRPEPAPPPGHPYPFPPRSMPRHTPEPGRRTEYGRPSQTAAFTFVNLAMTLTSTSHSADIPKPSCF